MTDVSSNCHRYASEIECSQPRNSWVITNCADRLAGKRTIAGFIRTQGINLKLGWHVSNSFISQITDNSRCDQEAFQQAVWFRSISSIAVSGFTDNIFNMRLTLKKWSYNVLTSSLIIQLITEIIRFVWGAWTKHRYTHAFEKERSVDLGMKFIGTKSRHHRKLHSLRNQYNDKLEIFILSTHNFPKAFSFFFTTEDSTGKILTMRTNLFTGHCWFLLRQIESENFKQNGNKRVLFFYWICK